MTNDEAVASALTDLSALLREKAVERQEKLGQAGLTKADSLMGELTGLMIAKATIEAYRVGKVTPGAVRQSDSVDQ